MRQKLRDRDRAGRPTHDDPATIHLPDIARQIALNETGNGWQHGVIEILIALLAAFMVVPLRPFRRSAPRDRR